MRENKQLENINEEQCGCCQTSLDDAAEKYDCAKRWTVFTKREERVLFSIRELGEKARKLKSRIDQLTTTASASSERLAALSELESLRQRRAELEKERIEAAEERMRLLGHA